jgi:hypothetical protein
MFPDDCCDRHPYDARTPEDVRRWAAQRRHPSRFLVLLSVGAEQSGEPSYDNILRAVERREVLLATARSTFARNGGLVIAADTDTVLVLAGVTAEESGPPEMEEQPMMYAAVTDSTANELASIVGAMGGRVALRPSTVAGRAALTPQLVADISRETGARVLGAIAVQPTHETVPDQLVFGERQVRIMVRSPDASPAWEHTPVIGPVMDEEETPAPRAAAGPAPVAYAFHIPSLLDAWLQNADFSPVSPT